MEILCCLRPVNLVKNERIGIVFSCRDVKRLDARLRPLSGREEAVRHATWFVGAVENFRFFDLAVHAFADPEGAVAEVKGEGLIKATGRVYHQDYVVFLRAVRGKIAFLPEYFDPVRAATALDTPILGRK
jgi:hypothetical protein